MSSNVAIIDDRNPLITYSGPWSQAGGSIEFDSTTTCSTTQGTSASFTFVGTSVTVYGTIAAEKAPNATMSFAVDKTTTGTFVPPSGLTSDVHHQTLWASPVLGNGTHTLVITQTEAQAACVLFLDYILYQTTSDTGGPYFIDDSDPSITYGASWTPAGSEYDFLHSTHGSTAVGATFSYTFQGKQISLYGDLNNGGLPSASISIDKGPPVSYVAPVQPTTVTSNNLFFNSGDIAEGTHTVVFTLQNANTLWLDYFLVTPNSPGFSPSSSAASAPSSSSSSESLGSNAPSKKHTPIGAIVGAVIGVLALAALTILLLFFCRRRRRQTHGNPDLAQTLPIVSAHEEYSNSSAPAFASAGTLSSFVLPGNNSVYPIAPPGAGYPSPPTSVTSAGTMVRQLHPAQGGPLAPVQRHAHNPSLTLSDSDLGSTSGNANPASSPHVGAVPRSDTSGSALSSQPRSQPPVSGILQNDKLTREARERQRWNEAHGVTPSSASQAPTVREEAPPQYAE
ncbi:hypothetical protein C8F04DRAFT_1091137 [Mycena alexandri]|uniref:Transmembrane protein n=1 Tax=Mycena alexandri TaxID=1745969 RepID=A0AAD6X3V2_9AGAR|nr:hypothetical protein C8F04DRAFT_1091137 [Mycena alexandri]